MIFVYGQDVLTGHYYYEQKMPVTCFIHLHGKLEEENGYDLCSIPSFGKVAKNHCKDEYISKCVVVLANGRHVNAQLHVVWNGKHYTGIVSDLNDEVSKNYAKQLAEKNKLKKAC